MMLRRYAARDTFIVLALSVLTTTAAIAQAPTATTPVCLAVVRQGESKELQICWDEGTGRSPVVFLSDRRVLAEPKLGGGLKGVPNFREGGITLQYDAEKSAEAQTALYASEKFTGRQADGAFKHVTVAAVRLNVEQDAEPDARSVFVHVVSGTGRNMRLVGELRVLVLE